MIDTQFEKLGSYSGTLSPRVYSMLKKVEENEIKEFVRSDAMAATLCCHSVCVSATREYVPFCPSWLERLDRQSSPTVVRMRRM